MGAIRLQADSLCTLHTQYNDVRGSIQTRDAKSIVNIYSKTWNDK